MNETSDFVNSDVEFEELDVDDSESGVVEAGGDMRI